MLSVLIETRNDEEALSRTLASLIGGAVEGAVRDVIVCDLGSTDQTRYVAEHAGCHFVAGSGIATGIARAKGDWLLILEPGARLVEGWIEPVAMHIAQVDDAGAFLARPQRAAAVPGAGVLGQSRTGAGPGDLQAAGVPAGQERRQRRSAGARPGREDAQRRDRSGIAEEGVSLRRSSVVISTFA